VARVILTGIDVEVDAVVQDASTTIGAIGGYAVVVATALPELGVMLTSSYLAEMVGDIAASQRARWPADHRPARPARPPARADAHPHVPA
jgi:hypothetical protein